MIKWLFGTGKPSRMDRVEQTIDKIVYQQAQNSASIAALIERQEQQRVAIDTLGHRQHREIIEQLTGAVNLLAAMVVKPGENE